MTTYTRIPESAVPDRVRFDVMTLAGCDIQIDLSGQGHAWRPANDDTCPAQIQREIEAEILDGDRETCDDYLASNGLHYRWS